ncbi:sulfite exporter TauE/SafE family protein [Siccirubricoccus sp. KC 17139]|uniref:Probable membrane transporter protein n=1 Tax=Siccirubricoccus soli TaxID=2899147 RepID=A0ABT1D791_9PROT|nr:sulfite exporter TauE/SafE family protein [Siccirubricoccus soli]MCO6417804.1 sulfite exporter TauE/SafE family protein [Siccirubricoccus soli]MCP2683939.1 sulfite exporter TauE/SafE family protein [Siccirubricoccus soli]
MFSGFDLLDAAVVAAIFLLAGLVKGLAGFGLPTVTLGLLALIRPLPEAMALMLVPTLLTNLWQAFAGPALRSALQRLWGFLLASGLGSLAGANILARSDAALLSGLLGLLLLASGAVALLGPPWPVPSPAKERWLSPLMGAVAGLIAGMTGSFLMPAAPWLVALHLSPQQFVQGFGLGVLAVTGVLAVAMAGHGLLPPDLGLASLAGVVPAFLGMALGQRLRHGMPEARFRRMVQAALGGLGAWLAWRAFG